MNLFKRVNWGMFGLGFGPGQSSDENKENDSPPSQTPPWVKKQKMTEFHEGNDPGPSLSLCPPATQTGGTSQDNKSSFTLPGLVQKMVKEGSKGVNREVEEPVDDLQDSSSFTHPGLRQRMVKEGVKGVLESSGGGGEGGRAGGGGHLHQGRAVETKLSKSDKSFLLELFPSSPKCQEAGL